MQSTALNPQKPGWPLLHNTGFLLSISAVTAIAISVLLIARGYNSAAALSVIAAGAIAFSIRPTLETTLIIWFVATPFASYVVRIPWDRSVITFNRAALILCICVLLLEKGREAVARIRLTAFETSWALLSIIALLSATLMSRDFGSAARIAIDAFWLPLIAYHLARHHFRLKSNANLILGGAMAIAVLLLVIGVVEFATGLDLFQYKGAGLFRAHERRVNGPFASDSSFSLISLLLLIFIIEAPRVYSIILDWSARLTRYASIAASFVAALLPLFRGTAMAMAACWLVTNLAWLKADKTRRRNSFKWGWILGVPVLLLAITLTGILDLSSISARLANPQNLIGRLSTWNTAVRVMTGNIAFGVGLNEYQSYFHSTYYIENDPVGNALDAKAVDSPHSNFLWIGSELGLPALLLYLFAIGNLVLISWRGLKTGSGKAAAVCSLGLITAYVLPGLELTSGYYSDLNLYFFFLIGLLANRFSLEATEDGIKQD